MKAIKLLFSIILIYFVITSNNAIGKKSKKKSSNSKPTSFPVNKTIEYYVESDLTDVVIKEAFVELESFTCLKFKRTKDISSSNTVVIKKGEHCGTTAEIINETIHYSIILNRDCMDYYYYMKLMNLNILMRYKLTKCITSKKSRTKQLMKEKDFYKVLRKYRCKIKALSGAFFTMYKSTLTFFTFKIPLKKNIEPKGLKQVDYNALFSFSDSKKINKIMCGSKCKNKEKGKCKNGGYLRTSNCKECICPLFYSGKTCKKYETSSVKPSCGKKILKPRSKKKK